MVVDQYECKECGISFWLDQETVPNCCPWCKSDDLSQTTECEIQEIEFDEI